jgi:hypothetical protein
MPGPVVERTVRCLVQGNFGKGGEHVIQTTSNWFKPRTALHESANLTLLFGATCVPLNEYKKCVVKEIPGSEYDPHPDVVIQFGWKNKWDYEVAPMNDLMQRGGVGIGNDGPHLRFLIKVWFTSNVPTGLDIHKVPNGCTVDDVINGTNGAAHWVQKFGQSDVVLQRCLRMNVVLTGCGHVSVPTSYFRGMLYGPQDVLHESGCRWLCLTEVNT